MEMVYQFRTNTTTKEIYIYIKVYKNRRPFIKQPIGSQVTKKREKGMRNSKVAYYNPTTKAKNLMTLFFILSPIFISPSEDKNSWIIAALF